MTHYNVRYVAIWDDFGTYDSLRVFSNGSSSAASTWSLAGTQNLINGYNANFQLSVSGETPSIAYSDRGNSGRLTVKQRSSGYDWTIKGAVISSVNYRNPLALLAGSTVMMNAGSYDSIFTWNGSSWQYLTYVHSSSNGDIQRYSNDIYSLESRSVSMNTRLTVQKSSGGAWSFVDSTGLDSVPDYGCNMIMYGEYPMVAYRDGPMNDQITVKYLVNNKWQLVGTRSFGSGADLTSRLGLIVTAGVPYVAFKDYDNGRGISVYRLR